jgi:hypothetical protein
MTNFVKMLIIPVLALSFACGGQIDDESATQDELKASLNFEPFDSYKTAQKHAARYGKNPVAVNLQAGIAADRTGYQWSWTFQCDGSIYVDVAVSEKTVRVTSHGMRALLMGVASFDPAKLAVNATDLVQILRKAGWRQPDSMTLTAPLTGKVQARWTATTSRTPTAPARMLFVDANSGDIQN